MQGDRTNIKDRRECNKIWTARSPEGVAFRFWYVYGTWGRGKRSLTRTLGYRRTKPAADRLVKEMKKLYY